MSYRPQLVAAIGVLQQAHREREACIKFMPLTVRSSHVNALAALMDAIGVPVADGEFTRDELEHEFETSSADSFLAACDDAIRWYAEKQLAKRGGDEC